MTYLLEGLRVVEHVLGNGCKGSGQDCLKVKQPAKAVLVQRLSGMPGEQAQ